ncbi:MAG: UDP-N-acetylmuramate dehydrogenase [Candidatus Yanofskybacteria bacterium]|nr:UDP-N-acetylmuramate dehydrogenase [Candidatus Yanofskybacteria bacterium]
MKHNIPLAPFTTFRIGGSARFFVEVKSADELAEAVKFKQDNRLSCFVLGGGSNILVSDDGFDGLVIKMNICDLWITDIECRLSTGVVLRAGAGKLWDDVVFCAVERNAGGIENLSLIPGTVGGAVYQNIGAYGAELKDVLKSVKVFDAKTGNIIELSNAECGFKYRSSIFKKSKDLIILEAELMLSRSKNYRPDTHYPDLKKKFNHHNHNINHDTFSVKLSYDNFTENIPTIVEIRQAVIEIRRSKIPYPDEVSNAGSFFKNPVIKISNFKSLISKYPDLKGHKMGDGSIKLSAAQLIEKAGFKGKRFGNVGVSDKHALVLVNYGGGTAKGLIDLAMDIKEEIRVKFDVKLELEVETCP